jgi:hypothetical protein
MISSLTSALASTLGLFDDEQRLYRLDSPCAELAGLHVQAWALREALSRPWELQLLAVSETQGLDLQALLGQPSPWSPAWPTAASSAAPARCCRPRPRTATAAWRATSSPSSPGWAF